MAYVMTSGPRGLTAGVLLLAGSCLSVAACSSAESAPAVVADASSAPAAPVAGCPEVSASRCQGARVQTCEARGQGSAWTEAVACPGEQACREGACSDPSPRQRAQAASIASFVDTLAQGSAWHLVVDADGVKARERTSILQGDGSDASFFGAAWRTLNAYPHGHQRLFAVDPSVCRKAMPYQLSSRFGVCGRPSAAGLAVTYARKDNLLGLSAGDVVIQAGEHAGDALFEQAYLRPVCGIVFPAPSGRRYAGAASFFGTVPAGMKLTVQAVDGATREVTVPPDADATSTNCRDPFSRSTAIYAHATMRSDGVAVIRLPSFIPFDKAFPAEPAEADAFIAAFQAEIVKVFDTVKAAPAIIWDARGNNGGITPVGLAIVAGFSSARRTSISYCRTRVPGSSPPTFAVQRYMPYEVVPGGSFAYAGKVAVVTDGLAYSAGDYFPYAAAVASGAPVVGSSSAGAFGGGNAPIEIDGPPRLDANFDPTACFSALTDLPLEGAPASPQVAVEYEARDLAAGKDTIVDRAAKVLGF